MAEPTDIDNVLDHLDSVAGQGLRKRSDMGTLLECAAERVAFEEINDLAFHGSFLYQLYQTLRKSPPGSDGYPAMEKEFAASVERTRELIAALLIDATEEQIERFNSVYFQATQGSLRNLIDLAHDLGVLKSVQNEQRHKGRDEE